MRSDRSERHEVLPTVEGRVPPHDLGAEQAVLSAALLDSAGDPSRMRLGAIDTVVDLLRPEHFYSEAHRRIWEACLDLHAANKPVDVIQVASWLKEHDRLQQIGGTAYIASILSAAPTVLSDHVRAYAQRIVDTHRVRQVIFTSQRISVEGYLAYGEQYGSADGYVEAAAESLYEISQASGKTSSTERIVDTVKKVVNDVVAMAQSGRTTAGVPTGIGRYDRVTGGLHKGDLTIVAARPGMGKTSLLLAWAISVARGNPGGAVDPAGVAIFSLEMPKEQLVTRMIAQEAKVDVSAFRNGQIAAHNWERITRAASELAVLPIWIDDAASLSVVDMRAKIRFMGVELARSGHRGATGQPLTMGLAIADYLQLMSGRDDGNRELEVSSISRGIKGLAKDLKIAAVAASQLNRASETRGDKHRRPLLSDLRESGAIEQDADNICFVYRDDYYNKDSAEPNIAELIIAKQRNGPTTTVKCRFDKMYTRFDNLADGDVDDARYGDG